MPILYSFRRCPYAMRARLALAVAGIACELREIDLKNKAAALLESSPKGTVPVLVLDDGTVLEESLDIVDWALNQHDPEDWLRSRSAALELIDHFGQHISKTINRYKYPDRYEAVDVTAERERCDAFFQQLDSLIADHQGAYLDGRTRSLIDMLIFPHIRQAANVDFERFLSLPLPNLIQWYHLISDTPLFATMMHKYPVWDQTVPSADIYPHPQDVDA